MDTQPVTRRLIPFGIAVGLMAEAMREAMAESQYLKGSTDAIVNTASSKLEGLLEQLGEPDHRTDTPILRLVIPARLGEAAALRGLAHAIQQTRNVLADQSASSDENAVILAARGDALREAGARGKFDGIAAARETIDNEIFAQFDIWDQAYPQFPMPDEEIADRAERLGVQIEERPQIPLPDDAAANAFLSELLDQRDRFVNLAVQLASIAEEPEDDGPQYYAERASAAAYATAADLLESSITSAHGLADEYTAFVEQHGTWLERFV